jgi:hypothetical protein
MNKILLAFAILGTSAGAFHIARQSTNRLSHEASVAGGAWLTQTQLVAGAQTEQAGLTERIRELKQALALSRPAVESALWSALQTNRADQLPQHLRERLWEELGFNWRSSPDYVVVSKQTVRDLQMEAIRSGKLTDAAAIVLALTPGERGQMDAATQRVRTEFNDWVFAHVERSDATNELRVKYISPDAALRLSVRSNFEAAVFRALRTNRAEFVGPSATSWMNGIGLPDYGYQTSMVIEREAAGNQQRLKAEISHFNPGEIMRSPGGIQSGYLPECKFPDAFRCTFPNGWADVAEREGFELPKESKGK